MNSTYSNYREASRFEGGRNTSHKYRRDDPDKHESTRYPSRTLIDAPKDTSNDTSNDASDKYAQEPIGRKNIWVMKVLKWFNEKGRIATIDIAKLKQKLVTFDMEEEDVGASAGGWDDTTNKKEQDSGEKGEKGEVVVDAGTDSRSAGKGGRIGRQIYFTRSKLEATMGVWRWRADRVKSSPRCR